MNRARDVVERLKQELVLIAQELGTVKAERDSLRVANEDLRGRVVESEDQLTKIREALNGVPT